MSDLTITPDQIASALRKQVEGFGRSVVDHGEVLFRVEPDIGCHHRDQLGGAELAYGLPFQVGDAADAAVGEQLIAAGMHTGQYRYRHTLIDRVDAQRRKVRNKVKISAHE